MLELINNIIYLQRKPKYKLLQSSKRTLLENKFHAIINTIKKNTQLC
mgnify:CR=1 FL=1